jgi:multiple sugar transport system substrate-binding protein
VALGAGSALALGTPGAMAERVGHPLTKKTTIRYYGLYWLGTEIKKNQQLVTAFNSQSTSVQLQYVQSSWSSIANQMTVAFSSGDVPDVFQYYDAGLVPWGQNGLLADLKHLLPASTWNGVNPGTLSALTTRQGAVMGLPYETETPLIYYNVDMFKQAGITPASVNQPWTWDQLRANAARLSNPKKGVYGIVAAWTSSQLFFKSGLGWQAGATPIHYNQGNYAIDASDPGDKAAIMYVAGLFHDKIADLGTLNADPFSNFLSGKAAMLIIGAWERSQFPAAGSKQYINWAAMPMVKGKVSNLGSGAAQTLSIPQNSKNKEAAAEFLSWWGRPENVAAMCEASDQIPPNRIAVQQVLQAVGATNYWNIALNEAQDLRGQPFCPGWLAMLGKVWDPAMIAVFQGKSTYDQFVATVNKNGTDFVQTAAGNY